MGVRKFSAEDVVARTTDLVTLPDIFLRVKAVVDAPDSSLEEVARVLSGDAGMVARLLKLANSSFFGFPSRVETISRAVTLLGTQQIHDLVLATSVAEAFADIEPDLMSLPDFWLASIRCGILARLLAIRCNVLDNERLFVEGLLHDIGHLALYQVAPDACATALQLSRDEGVPVHQCEAELIGCSYAEVGAELMRRWNFPPTLIEATRCQNSPTEAQEYGLETALVHIAVCLKTLDIPTMDRPPELDCVDPLAWQRTGLAAADMGSLMQAAAPQVSSTLDTLFPQFSRSA